MSRNDHPNKEIRKAIDEALDIGWMLKKSSGHAHAWGRLFCPADDQSGCIVSIYSTPRNSQNHAAQIRRKVNACPHADN